MFSITQPLLYLHPALLPTSNSPALFLSCPSAWIRRLARSTLVLIPLFGAHYIFYVAWPYSPGLSSPFDVFQLYFEMTLNSLQVSLTPFLSVILILHTHLRTHAQKQSHTNTHTHTHAHTHTHGHNRLYNIFI